MSSNKAGLSDDMIRVMVEAWQTSMANVRDGTNYERWKIAMNAVVDTLVDQGFEVRDRRPLAERVRDFLSVPQNRAWYENLLSGTEKTGV